MVHVHLGDVCPRSMGVRILEVGLKVVDGGLECSDLAAEASPCRGSRGRSAASIVVQQHERNVVPVLWLAARKRSSKAGNRQGPRRFPLLSW